MGSSLVKAVGSRIIATGNLSITACVTDWKTTVGSRLIFVTMCKFFA